MSRGGSEAFDRFLRSQQAAPDIFDVRRQQVEHEAYALSRDGRTRVRAGAAGSAGLQLATVANVSTISEALPSSTAYDLRGSSNIVIGANGGNAARGIVQFTNPISSFYSILFSQGSSISGTPGTGNLQFEGPSRAHKLLASFITDEFQLADITWTNQGSFAAEDATPSIADGIFRISLGQTTFLDSITKCVFGIPIRYSSSAPVGYNQYTLAAPAYGMLLKWENDTTYGASEYATMVKPGLVTLLGAS